MHVCSQPPLLVRHSLIGVGSMKDGVKEFGTVIVLVCLTQCMNIVLVFAEDNYTLDRVETMGSVKN